MEFGPVGHDTDRSQKHLHNTNGQDASIQIPDEIVFVQGVCVQPRHDRRSLEAHLDLAEAVEEVRVEPFEPVDVLELWVMLVSYFKLLGFRCQHFSVVDSHVHQDLKQRISNDHAEGYDCRNHGD